MATNSIKTLSQTKQLLLKSLQDYLIKMTKMEKMVSTKVVLSELEKAQSPLRP